MKTVIEIRHYVSRAGKDVFDEWLSELADARAQAKIATRIDRLAAGNFGDCKPLQKGLSEPRIDWGPGLLCDGGEGLRSASLRRRQAKAVRRHQPGGRVTHRL
jgi:putative component of toxin-antitoxin plasmid stabilization module